MEEEESVGRTGGKEGKSGGGLKKKEQRSRERKGDERGVDLERSFEVGGGRGLVGGGGHGYGGCWVLRDAGGCYREDNLSSKSMTSAAAKHLAGPPRRVLTCNPQHVRSKVSRSIASLSVRVR